MWSEPPGWLVALSWVALAVAVICAAWIAWDILGKGYRQKMPVMDAVWPVTALYWGPLAVWAYTALGRARSPQRLRELGRDEPPNGPGWAPTAIGVSHCGAGCTLGDIVAEWAVFLAGATLLGSTLLAEYVGDFVLALVLGLAFQYFAIAPMRGLGLRKGLVAAAKADTLSLVAFEVGLFAWMALMSLVLFPAPHHLHPDSPVYWFGMQIGMVVGFFTSWPVNVWLIQRGLKEAM